MPMPDLEFWNRRSSVATIVTHLCWTLAHIRAHAPMQALGILVVHVLLGLQPAFGAVRALGRIFPGRPANRIAHHAIRPVRQIAVQGDPLQGHRAAGGNGKAYDIAIDIVRTVA